MTGEGALRVNIVHGSSPNVWRLTPETLSIGVGRAIGARHKGSKAPVHEHRRSPGAPDSRPRIGPTITATHAPGAWPRGDIGEEEDHDESAPAPASEVEQMPEADAYRTDRGGQGRSACPQAGDPGVYVIAWGVAV